MDRNKRPRIPGLRASSGLLESGQEGRAGVVTAARLRQRSREDLDRAPGAAIAGNMEG